MHSAKDVPAQCPTGLALVGVPERADARDALRGAPALDVLPPGAGWARAPFGAALSSSLRPISGRSLRGNVDTRLRRLAEGARTA